MKHLRAFAAYDSKVRCTAMQPRTTELKTELKRGAPTTLRLQKWPLFRWSTKVDRHVTVDNLRPLASTEAACSHCSAFHDTI